MQVTSTAARTSSLALESFWTRTRTNFTVTYSTRTSQRWQTTAHTATTWTLTGRPQSCLAATRPFAMSTDGLPCPFSTTKVCSRCAPTWSSAIGGHCALPVDFTFLRATTLAWLPLPTTSVTTMTSLNWEHTELTKVHPLRETTGQCSLYCQKEVRLTRHFHSF